MIKVNLKVTNSLHYLNGRVLMSKQNWGQKLIFYPQLTLTILQYEYPKGNFSNIYLGTSTEIISCPTIPWCLARRALVERLPH